MQGLNWDSFEPVTYFINYSEFLLQAAANVDLDYSLVDLMLLSDSYTQEYDHLPSIVDPYEHYLMLLSINITTGHGWNQRY